MIKVDTKSVFKVNVILLVVFVLTVLLLFTKVDVEASTSVEFPSAPISTEYPYYTVIQYPNGSYVLFTMKSQKSMVLEDYVASTGKYDLRFNTGDCCMYDLSDDYESWTYRNAVTTGYFHTMKQYDENMVEITNVNVHKFMRANYHIYYKDGVFFRRSPLEVVQLNRELAKANPMEIVEVVVGLIQLLMLSIVAFVSFRKSWQFLRRQLGQ